jgi:hypothetical protein
MEENVDVVQDMILKDRRIVVKRIPETLTT